MNIHFVFVIFILTIIVEKGRTKSSVGWDRDGKRTDSELEFSVSSAPSSGGDFYQLEGEINGARGGHLLNSFLGLIDSFSNFHHDRPNHVSQWSQWARPSGGIFGNKRPNEGTNRPNGVNILPNPPSNRPNNGVNGPNGGSSSNGGSQLCSSTNQCGKGVGDCETDKDCREGLFCGKNNCKGEFGGLSPEGSLWDEKDDCCTDNKDYCNQADLFPWWRTTCCTTETPCRFSHGDCDKDEECAQNLVCGDNNCQDFHVEAGQKDDCCTYPEYRHKRSRETGEFESATLSGNKVIQLIKDEE